MEKKIKKLITKLKKENDKFKKALDEGLSKYNSSRARQTIQMNIVYMKDLENLLS